MIAFMPEPVLKIPDVASRFAKGNQTTITAIGAGQIPALA